MPLLTGFSLVPSQVEQLRDLWTHKPSIRNLPRFGIAVAPLRGGASVGVVNRRGGSTRRRRDSCGHSGTSKPGTTDPLSLCNGLTLSLRHMRIAIIGAGGVGGLTAGILSRAGHDVLEPPRDLRRLVVVSQAAIA